MSEDIRTNTGTGKLQLYVFVALAAFERNLARERISKALASVRARGQRGCRPSKYKHCGVVMQKKS